jgi:hypothetical protein
LLTGREAEAKKLLSGTPAMPTDPLYYYLHAAWQFKHNQADDARGYLAPAFQIDPGSANMAFVDSLIELGYVNPEELRAAGHSSAPAAANAPSSATPQSAAPAAAIPDISGLEDLLPSLDADKDKKK